MQHAVIKELIIAGDGLAAAFGDPAKRGGALEAWQNAVRSANQLRTDLPRLRQDIMVLVGAGADLVGMVETEPEDVVVGRIKRQWNDAVKEVWESTTCVTELQSSAKVTLAPTLLIDAADAIENRASQRDKPDGERSMRCAVNTFNALTGQQLSEREGWIFMVLLKLARAQSGTHTRDDYVDGAGYLALACESVELEK